jgi:uncharacterized protein YidB (DUF937 family)
MRKFIKKITNRIFRHNCHNPLCKDNLWGCRCGDFLFGGGEEETPEVEAIYDPFAGLRGKLTQWLTGKIGQPAEQYGKEIVAPMGEEEKRSFDFLRKFTDMPTPESLTLGGEELKRTLTGGYDPSTSPYYQAVKAQAQKNLEDTLGDIASSAAGAGGYRTGARMALQRTARTDVTQGLNTMLGQLSEAERVRRLQAVPYAMQLGEYQQKLPLQQAMALQALGALPRTIQQAQNEAAYNEWLRATQEYPMQIAQLASPFAGAQPTLGQVGYQPSIFDKYIMPAGKSAMEMAILAMMMG